MYEVEAKVHITKSDFSRFKKKLDKVAKFKEDISKKDIYYDNIKKSYFIRTRTKGRKGFLDIKNKGRSGGMETNAEMRWKIKDIDKFKKLLSKLSIKPIVRKTKKTISYIYKNFTIELNFVNKLGYFLEIERIINRKSQIKKAKKDLLDIFREFGYTQKDFEKKYYLELLEEVR